MPTSWWFNCCASLFPQQSTVDKLIKKTNLALVVGTHSWRDQFMEAITVSAGEGKISKPMPASPAWDELCLGSADSICLVRDARLLGVWCSLSSSQKGFLRSERREAGYSLYFPPATKRNCSCGNSVSILGAMFFPRTASFFLHLSLFLAIFPPLPTYFLFPHHPVSTQRPAVLPASG